MTNKPHSGAQQRCLNVNLCKTGGGVKSNSTSRSFIPLQRCFLSFRAGSAAFFVLLATIFLSVACTEVLPVQQRDTAVAADTTATDSTSNGMGATIDDWGEGTTLETE